MEQLEINLKLNNEKLEKEQGIKFCETDSMLYYVQGLLYALKSHNKNYTKEQERLIDTVDSIINCLEAK